MIWELICSTGWSGRQNQREGLPEGQVWDAGSCHGGREKQIDVRSILERGPWGLGGGLDAGGEREGRNTDDTCIQGWVPKWRSMPVWTRSKRKCRCMTMWVETMSPFKLYFSDNKLLYSCWLCSFSHSWIDPVCNNFSYLYQIHPAPFSGLVSISF